MKNFWTKLAAIIEEGMWWGFMIYVFIVLMIVLLVVLSFCLQSLHNS